MLSRLTIKLDTNGEKLRYSQSALFHGWLMQFIPSSAAEELHQSQFHPYSQYLFYDGESWVWRVQTLTEKARDQIMAPLMEHPPEAIYIAHSDSTYGVTDISCEERAYSELFEKNYIDDPREDILRIRMLSPMAFKSAGRYVRFPEPHYVFSSLIRRFDLFSGNMLLENEKLMQEIDEKLNVGEYNIRSSSFALEGVRIPAFIGSVSYYPRGNQQWKNMLHMLMDFAEYSGIGIKTSLGMGAICQEEGRKRIVREK